MKPLGTLPLDGADRVAAFARWLLQAPPEGAYEREFTLVDGAVQDGSGLLAAGTRLFAEVLLGRDEAGGPESLEVWLTGDLSVGAFEVCAPQVCEPFPRQATERAAARLLAACAEDARR